MAEPLTKAGRYQIVGELGRGSMGVVYKGFDPVIGRTVAIKTMLPEGLSPQEFQEYKARFQREATAAGILAHPNIITVYDFGEDNGVLYLAMEYLEGKSLEKIVQEQMILPIETILPIYDQVCTALDHAHRNKVVHRDIKPANIMILENGLVKVTDFGIAKMMTMGMTQVGQILGTPNYMSPEQVKGRQVDGRSDIFSLGVILYELVTGEKPFAGQNITTVIYKIINENPIPPRELDASIHAGLSYVINKALAKNVDERYQSCQELAQDLRNYKNLGGTATASGTVVMKTAPLSVPPVSPPPAAALVAAAPIDEVTLGSPEDIEEVPPPVPHRQALPQIAWVLGALLLLAIMGGLSYVFVLRPRSQPAARAVPASVANVTPASNPPAPVTPATPPGAPVTATAAPAPAAKPATPQPAEPAPPPAPAASTHERPAHAAAPKLGQLMVSANLTGARIFVDGRSDPGWVTPHTIADIPAGAHNVQISMAGYDDFVQSVTVGGGQTSNVVGTLSAPRAELDILTEPQGIEVLIDGKSYGQSPVHATLPTGTHTYTVRPPGAPPYENSVNLKSGQIITKKLTIGGAVVTGILEVRTRPPGATVLADGAPVGGQTPTSFRLSAGTHTLVISLSGYAPIRRQVAVTENATTPVNVNLTSQ